jgi:hypothetical protein
MRTCRQRYLMRRLVEVSDVFVKNSAMGSMERLGHAKVGTTLDIYSHVTPGLQQAAALRFEESLAAYADSEQSVEAVLG